MKTTPRFYLQHFIGQVQLDVRGDDDRVEVGGDEDEKNGRKLFPVEDRELDGAKDEEGHDGRQVDDQPRKEEPLVAFRGAVYQSEISKNLKNFDKFQT